MRNYTPQEYVQLVENSKVEWFRKYMEAEKEYLINLAQQWSKDFIELWAWYGRVIPTIHDFIDSYLGIELNKEMYRGLTRTTEKYPKSKALFWDITTLVKTLWHTLSSSTSYTLLLLQNTIWTIEGDLSSLENGVKEFFNLYWGNLILSVLKRKSLATLWVEFYSSIEPICGQIDFENSDFSKGIFKTKTWYTSQWRLDQIEIFVANLNWKVLNTAEYKDFYIFNISRK